MYRYSCYTAYMSIMYYLHGWAGHWQGEKTHTIRRSAALPSHETLSSKVDGLCVHICVYIYTYIYICIGVSICIYIYIERERGISLSLYMYVSLSLSIYIYNIICVITIHTYNNLVNTCVHIYIMGAAKGNRSKGNLRQHLFFSFLFLSKGPSRITLCLVILSRAYQYSGCRGAMGKTTNHLLEATETYRV